MQTKLLVFLLFFVLNTFVSSCSDLTVNGGQPWYDSAGTIYTCDWYGGSINRCRDDGYLFENFGMVANEACCVCGGGIKNPTKSPRPTSSPPPSASPSILVMSTVPTLYPSSSPYPTSTCIVDTSKCHAYYPSSLGDGYCSEWLNTKACCYDGGDCKQTMYGPYAMIGGVAIMVLLCCCNLIYQKKISLRQQNPRTRRVQNPVILSDEEKEVRREHVLKNIIHKKVVTKGRQNELGENEVQQDGCILFPHETIVKERSMRQKSVKFMDDEFYDEERGGAINVKKDDICIETLRSIRSKRIIENVDNIDESLYSPRSCPICCEDYVKGDDVAWSKNEDCCHAYHTDCIVPWLMDHDDCPMCRCVYVVKEE